MFLVVDAYSQESKTRAKRITRLKEFFPGKTVSLDGLPESEAEAKHLLERVRGVVVSGTNLRPEEISGKTGVSKLELLLKTSIAGKKPVMGICFGGHVLLNMHGSTLKQVRCTPRQTRLEALYIHSRDAITSGLQQNQAIVSTTLYEVIASPFELIASANNAPRLLKSRDGPYYAVLFHPETLHGKAQTAGKRVLENFKKICLT